MSVVVFAAPVAVVRPPVVEEQPEYTHLWTGPDGVTWDMNDWGSGVYMAPGLVGMAHPSIERWTDSSPAVAGNLFGGARALAKNVQWPIVITTQTIDGRWRDLVRRWWGGWSTTQAGTWSVVDSSGRKLSIDLRHNPSGDFALDIDPGLIPWVPWTVDAVADFPYWRGDPIIRSWQPQPEYLFFGGGDPATDAGTPAEAGPPFYISSSAALNTATITNPGQIPVSVEWTVTGPFDGINISISGGQLIGPAVTAGDTVVISTDPTYPIAIKNGTTEVFFSKWEPRQIPPGQAAPITFSANGTGTVQAKLTPLFEMGF